MKTLLIANRGEVALRIIAAARELGLKTVVIYAEPDADSLPVQQADAAYLLSGAEASVTYLDQDKILDIAQKAQVDAIHPGYGFLSENAGFAKKVIAAGLTWVGPTWESIEILGSKTNAKKIAEQLGVPLLPSWQGASTDTQGLLKWVTTVGFPVLVKASAGGGGRGMRLVQSEAELLPALAAAAEEAKNSFGDASVFVEKYLEEARHIEVQIVGDAEGNLVHLGERECSLQRRHQKVMEETPSPSIDDTVRQKLFSDALKLGKFLKYQNVGTVEFIVDQKNQHYLLEINTRLQVEHPVTEFITGIDIVKTQLLLAQGHNLFFKQEDIVFRGHAIEARIYAEVPEQNFIPSLGTIQHLLVPIAPGVRLDSAMFTGLKLSPYYDAMLAKLCCYGFNRKEALQKIQIALQNMVILGIQHNLNFLQDLLASKEVQAGKYHIHLIEKFLKTWMKNQMSDEQKQVLLESILMLPELKSQKAGDDENFYQKQLKNFSNV